MAWNPLDSPINIVIMRGVPTPGNARVEGAKREIKVDEVGGFGVSGALTIVHGKKLAKFDVVIELTTPEEWEEWENFKSIVLTMPSGPEAKAIAIWHPWLQMLDVRACIVDTVSQPENDGTGIYTIRVSCTEFRKPKPAPPAAREASTDTQKDERSPAERVIDDLTNQVDQLTLRDQYQDISPYQGRR